MGVDAAIQIGGAMSGALLNKEFSKLLGGDAKQDPLANIDNVVSSANSILNKGLNSALSYSGSATNSAVAQQQQSQGQAVNALNSSLNSTTNAVNNTINSGVNQYKAAQSPYALAGYNAQDALSDSLGLARPAMGSASMAQTLQNLNSLQPQLQSLQSAGQAAGVSNPYNNPGAPTFNQAAPTLNSYNNNPQQAYAAIVAANQGKNNMVDPYTGKQLGLGANTSYQTATSYDKSGALNNILTGDASKLNQQQYQSALGAYNTAQQQFNTNTLQPYNTYNQQYGQVQGALNGLDPNAVQQALAYQQGQSGPITKI